MAQPFFGRWRGCLGILLLAGLVVLGGCSGSSSSTPAQNGSNAGAGGTSSSGSGSGGPGVSLSASDLTVAEGGSTTLRWSATGADSCTASGGWSGSLPASGSRTVGPLTAATTFSLSCAGSGGSTLEMISVAVVGPVPVAWIAPEENVDGSALTDLAGYRIYYGSASRTYSDMLEIGDPTVTSHSLRLASGDYYVAMTAFDGGGNESGYSNEVVKTRL